MKVEFNVFEKPEFMPFRFKSSKEVYEGMKDYQKADREIFLTLHLTATNQVIKCQVEGVGDTCSSAVYPKQIIKSAIMNGSSALIFIHNHPSGDPKPSTEDKTITKRLVGCCELFNIKLLDHVILGDNLYYSMADEGLIDEFEQGINHEILNGGKK